MRPDVKFCGMTRVEDAREACRLHAGYVGVIFAGGPRMLSTQSAALVFCGVSGDTRRVGVFGPEPAESIVAKASSLELDVVQLHGDPEPSFVEAIRTKFRGEIWAVLRIRGAELPGSAMALFREADAVVLDAQVPGKLGGSGIALPWGELAEKLDGPRQQGRLVLAGGLRPENVATAIAALSPDVVDVSSGVESEIGIKDHERMRAFSNAVLGQKEER